jgi:hypothetical protein
MTKRGYYLRHVRLSECCSAAPTKRILVAFVIFTNVCRETTNLFETGHNGHASYKDIIKGKGKVEQSLYTGLGCPRGF